jgi:ParB-like chromosome segregation protein Spo0J
MNVRVVKLDFVEARELLAHPMNARRHPNAQREALRGSIEELGFVAPLIVNARTGYLLDGHLRVEEALLRDERAQLPVVYVDLSEEEEALFLASYDYIATMASFEPQALKALIESIEVEDERVRALLSEINEAFKLDALEEEAFPVVDEDIPTEHCCPKCGYRWSGKSNACD